MDLSLSFYDVTKNTNEDSFKNEDSNIILSRITEALERFDKEVTIVEIGLPEIITDKTRKRLNQIVKYFKPEPVSDISSYLVFVRVPEQINDISSLAALYKAGFELTSVSLYNHLFVLLNDTGNYILKIFGKFIISDRITKY